MKDSDGPLIDGSWTGFFSYNLPGSDEHPFEAVIVSTHSSDPLANVQSIEGNILDDGFPGEARLTGTYSFPYLTFIKHYFDGLQQPVHYEGIMSADGEMLAGTWQIKSGFTAQEVSGNWEMRRTD